MGGRKWYDPGRNSILGPLICVCLGGRVHPRTPTLWGPWGPLKHNLPTSPHNLCTKHTIVFFIDLAVRFITLALIFASCKLGLLVLLEKYFHRFGGEKKWAKKENFSTILLCCARFFSKSATPEKHLQRQTSPSLPAGVQKRAPSS